MNLNLTKLFPKSSPNVEVIAGRDMIVTVTDGTQRSVTVGDRFEVARPKQADIDQDDRPSAIEAATDSSTRCMARPA